ncbi:hypothetical protein HAX54_020563 [Datura stramonium]|uniref:Pentatricopeptide repeat-containing protein n=1 Tax=Datura stramonium TaxID=4076 RepID=A0ABS8UTB2_DATST|nr:hypothetical protein [Datura stramonium]
MIIGLAKSGEIDDSWRLFGEMPNRNDVSWNSMISGFVRNGMWSEALDLFSTMQKEKIKPSEFTLVSLLNACGHLGALEQGNWIYNYVKKNNVELNVIVVTAIIDMCCRVWKHQEMAWQVFESVYQIKRLSSWNSMILGLGLVDKAKDYFQLMKKEYACRSHGNMALARWSAENLLELDPNESSGYVLMANMYAASGQFEEAMDERISMKEKQIEKRTKDVVQ